MPVDPTTGNLPITPDDVKEWWSRIELDRQARKKQSENWRRLLTSYLPPPGGASTYDTNSNIHFRNCHLKIAEVWAQMPELILTPLEPLADLQQQTGLSSDDIVAIKRAVLNKLLGRDHANVDLTIQEALFDIFATSGIGATKIAYQADTVDTQQAMAGPPQNQPGAVLNLQQFPSQQMQTVPVTIYQRFRWYRFSAEKLGIPSDFHSTNYDEAPYLFMEFLEPLTDKSRKAYNLPSDFTGSIDRDEMLLSKDQNVNMPGKKKLLHGIEIWLYAAQFDPSVAHSQHMRRLVLIEGLKERAAIYVDSPFQRFGPNGELLVDQSMVGNPIHPITLRVASDLTWIPSDAAFTDPLVRIENTWMTQDIKMRDSNLPRFFHSDKITAAVDKLKNMDTGQGVAIPHDLMVQGDQKLIAPLPKLEHAQADVEGRRENQRAITETLGISPNQVGGVNATVRSATELALASAGSNVRLKGEQAVLFARVLQGVRKFDALIQMFLDEPGYIQIVGRDGTQKLAAFTQAHLSGRYSYDAHPDSQLTIDLASKRKEFLDLVNFLAKSGYLNMAFVARRAALLFGLDPAQTVQQPQPPPQPPPPHPNVSLALKASDLAIPEVQIVLQQLGIQLPQAPSPELQMERMREAAKATPHGGAAEKADLVDKHQTKETNLQPGQPVLSGTQQQRTGLPVSPRPQ